MKQFFGAFFGSIIGILVTGIVCVVIFGLIVAGSIKSAFSSFGGRETVTFVKANSVLRLKLDGRIHDRGFDNPFEDLDLGPFGREEAMGLNDLTASIRKAKTDEKIKGIYLDIRNLQTGFATIEEIRNALIDFKTSGKFVYAYSEMYSQREYYLASVATKLFMNPQGGMEFKGLSSQLLFFKTALDKLNIEMQIFRHGKFKSAIEPFMLDKMSDANRLQVETYMNSIWNSMLDGISKQRNLGIDELNKLANNLSINSPQAAVDNKLVDALLYEDEMMELMKKDLKIEGREKIAFTDVSKYKSRDGKIATKTKSKASAGSKIAVVYAVGSIESGEGSDETIGSDRIAKAIRDARTDSSVKAVVLRVNSPGGSALASDVIWREVVLTKLVKPVAVSMGDLAASGGYYISCAANRIFAQPNTITGSIGVFGVLPNAQKAFTEKLGIHIDTVNTNKHSDVGSIFRPVTEEEKAYVQNGVEKVYETFISRVAEGRKTTTQMVDSIGQGRVWSGADAMKINLVDELGGLDKAIAWAAKKAGVSDYKVLELPRQKDPLSDFLNKGTEEMESCIMQKNLGEQYTYLKFIKNLVNQKGVQARLPYELIIE